ncbi:Glycosyl transferase family 2 [anaerobic digester metagenome]
MTTTRISVIVPTYNQARYLPTCLDSVWFQEWGNLEIIVVNDGSTDDTLSVLERYQYGLDKDKVSFASRYDAATDTVERTFHKRYDFGQRIFRVIHLEQNSGLSAALNTGFSMASGKLCTFTASDDILLPHMLMELEQAMTSSKADFAYADMHIVDDEGRILRRFTLPDYSFQACFCDWYMCGVSKLYKKELHDKFGLYDSAYTVQDHELYLRFAIGGAKFVHVPKVLMHSRIHAKDRQVDNHSPQGMSRLYRESAQLVLLARATRTPGASSTPADSVTKRTAEAGISTAPTTGSVLKTL